MNSEYVGGVKIDLEKSGYSLQKDTTNGKIEYKLIKESV